MRLTEIKLDATLWPRTREDKETVEHYAEIFQELPPIVIQKGTGKLVDGWHRWYAASKLGLTEVQVEEVKIPDNLLFAEAVKRNLKHGVPLKKHERNRAILRLSDAGLSTHQVANILGCHQSTVSLVLKASRVQVTGDEYSSLPLLHRVAIADAPPDKQPEIAKTVMEKRLTEKETKNLIQAMSSPLLTDEDRDAMLHNPVTRPYLRDERGEKVQSLDSAMREIDSVKKMANGQATVKFWKTLQQLDKELSAYRPEEIARGTERLTLPLALETANSITRWFEAFKLEGAKLGYWEVSAGGS
jgi:ParB-like chromosome segregation protein Spo0J